jgi:ADP-ribose pyrophosphatase YjhB (NUDIX family)
MSKPYRNAIAVILRNKHNPAQFLAIKRPLETGDLEGFWGLPAVRMREGELPEDAARRICREKLGCEAVPLRFIGSMFQKRTAYDLFFMDIEMLLAQDTEPDVHKATTNATRYVDQQWTEDASLLLQAAHSGSCCSSILLTDVGLLRQEEWVLSLEGNAVVR